MAKKQMRQKSRPRAAKFAKLRWELYGNKGHLMVVTSGWRVCVAEYFENAAGSYTALGKTYKTAEGAKRAIERALVWKGKR